MFLEEICSGRPKEVRTAMGVRARAHLQMEVEAAALLLWADRVGGLVAPDRGLAHAPGGRQGLGRGLTAPDSLP